VQHGKTSSYETLNLRSHAYLYIEPNKIHFDIIVKIFKLNLSLFYFDGSICAKKENKFNSGKQYFYYSKTFNTPTINLFYNLNHYSTYYGENDYINNRHFLKNPLLDLKDTIFFEDKYCCEDCNKKDTYLVLFIRQNIKVCYNCLKKMVDKVLFERAKYLDLENYISRECKNFI